MSKSKLLVVLGVVVLLVGVGAFVWLNLEEGGEGGITEEVVEDTVDEMSEEDLLEEGMKARNIARIADIQQVATALVLYSSDEGFFPESDENGDCLESDSDVGELIGDYMSAFPVDPGESPNLICGDAYFYYSYQENGQMVLAASLESGGLDSAYDYYCGIYGFDFFVSVDSIEELAFVLTGEEYQCTGDEDDRPVHVFTYSSIDEVELDEEVGPEEDEEEEMTDQTVFLNKVCTDPEAEYCFEGYWEYLDADGNVIPLPEQIHRVIDWINPGGFEPFWAFSNDLKWIIFFDFEDYSVQLFNTETETSSELMTLRKTDEWDWNIQFFGWNESGGKTGFVVQSDQDDYPEGTKVFILTLEDGEMVQKDKYNIGILERCPGNFCEIRVGWYDDDTLLYQPSDSEWWDFDYFEDCKEMPACTKTYDL